MAKAKSRKGFTIIEVVLVLAVAGLIFLMVFVALPALQASQKDTQRRDDYGMLAAAITSYASSNNGRLYKFAGATSRGANSCKPFEQKDAMKYLNSNGEDENGDKYAEDPDGKKYLLEACTWSGWEGNHSDAEPAEQQIFVIVDADCNGNVNGHDAPAKSDGRSFVVYGYMASGSGTYCSVTEY